MFVVRSNFVGNFKLGDNINHNLRILALLYELQGSQEENKRVLLNKPITVLIVSIIEAILADFHNRVRVFTIEGVYGIAKEIVDSIRGKEINKFKSYIDSVRKNNLFKKSPTFYQKLELLMKLRNRVHIQNEFNDLEPDDQNVYTDERRELAEKILEIISKHLSLEHPRFLGGNQYVKDFTFPFLERETGVMAIQPVLCPYCLTPAYDYSDVSPYQCDMCHEVF